MRNAVSPTDARPWLWAALTIVGLVVAFLAAFVVAVSIASRLMFPDAGPDGLRVDLAGLLLLSGAFGIGGVLVAGRVAFGSWLDARPRHLVLPVAGVALAIGVELALHEWARLTIGYYDSDFIGWTAGLSFSVVLVAVTWFGVAVAPPGANAPPRIGMGLSAILVLLIVLSNVPGLGDGIEPRSMPLAILVGLAAIYAIGALITGVRGGTPR
ncbi:MAG TPA: hypothetical protein VEW95_07180 [Candidatus Limnocylindrales bacterium]|nr:hypothetical protein [Candidatus Limnocylindrales bacterium]